MASAYTNSSIIPAGTQYLRVDLVNDGTGWKTHLDNVAIDPGLVTLFDPLNDLTKCYASSNVGLDQTQPWLAAGDTSRAYNNSPSAAATLVYQLSNFSDFKTRVYGTNGGGALNFYASPDGVTWSSIATVASQQHTTIGGGFAFYDVPVSAIPAGMNYLKIEFPAGATGTTQIGDVTLLTSRQASVFQDNLWDMEKMLSFTNVAFSVDFNVLGYMHHLTLANDTDNGAMVYHYPNIGSFDLKILASDMAPDNRVLAYGSPDNVTWTQIPTANTAPDETDGYYWVDSHYTPAGAIPTNTNFLKLVLVNPGAGWKTIASSLFIFPMISVIISVTNAIALNGGAFSYQITASSTPTSYAASGLPPGLTLNAATGLIGGTPTVNGTYAGTISAINANETGTTPFTITVYP